MSDDLFLVDTTSIAQAEATSASAAGSASEAVDEPVEQPTAGEQSPAPSGGTRRPRNTSAVFDWTESIPGAGACQATMFTGTFECQVATLVGRPETLYGSISIVLESTSEAQTLDISGGQITVYDQNMIRIVIAGLTGELDCTTQRFQATIDPTPSAPMPLERQIAWVNPNAQPITTGTLRGSLNPDLQVLDGDLEVIFDPSRCAGDFSVKGAVE